MKTTLVFIIQAYDLMTDTGQLQDVVVLELMASNVDEAIGRAKKMIKKRFYRLSQVIEKEKTI